MLGRLNHTALAVPDLAAAARLWREVMGAKISEPLDLPGHGVTTIFVDLPDSRIELIHPLGGNSPIHGFLARHPGGGIHHLCYEVDDIAAAARHLAAAGLRPLGEPRPGAHGKLVLFLHPRDVHGVLIELEQAETV